MLSIEANETKLRCSKFAWSFTPVVTIAIETFDCFERVSLKCVKKFNGV